MRVGIQVICKICHQVKVPHGRSVPYYALGHFCTKDCRGYDLPPLPGCLWPGEKEEDFGYPICNNAVAERWSS